METFENYKALAEQLTTEIMNDFGSDIIGDPDQTDRPLNKAWKALSSAERMAAYNAHREVVRKAIERILATQLGKVLV